MRRLLTGLLGASLLLAACGGDDGRDEAAAVTSIPDDTTTSTTTTTAREVPPPDVIPSDPSLITEEYVEQVLNALFAPELEAIRLAREEGVVDEPSIALLEATSTEEAAPQRINDLLAASSQGFEGLSKQPSGWVFDVLALLDAGPDCIVAEVRSDSTGLYPDSSVPEGAREFIRLYPASDEQRATGLNPTAWLVDEFPVTLDGSDPHLSCNG